MRVYSEEDPLLILEEDQTEDPNSARAATVGRVAAVFN